MSVDAFPALTTEVRIYGYSNEWSSQQAMGSMDISGCN